MSWWGQHAMGADGLVSEAIKAVSLAELGVAPETALGAELLAFYGKSSVAEMLEWFTRRHQPATRADRLSAARTVTAVAGRGDAVAQEIVDEQGRRLALYAEIAARKVGLRDGSRPISVVLTGSVLMAPASPVVDALDAHLREMLPGAVAHRAVLHPVAGAALDAIAEGGVPVNHRDRRPARGHCAARGVLQDLTRFRPDGTGRPRSGRHRRGRTSHRPGWRRRRRHR